MQTSMSSFSMTEQTNKRFYSGFHLSVELPIKTGQMAKLRKGALYQQHGLTLVAQHDKWVYANCISLGYSILVGKKPVDGELKPWFYQLAQPEKEKIVKMYGTPYISDLAAVFIIKGSGIYLPISNPMVSWHGGCEADINEFVF